jgi:hypothetical protein
VADIAKVYRVNWLRAKARFDRWKEEVNLVQHEMQWTVNWFDYQHHIWGGRAEASLDKGQLGHASYAWKQQEMWKDLMESSKDM